MTADRANAAPEKRFFIHLITRDITLEHAILDLIDNSINSLLKDSRINLMHSVNDLTRRSHQSKLRRQYVIDINIDATSFTIHDNCGGIAYEDARGTVFRFGRPSSSSRDILSVYGIGLKRALFKIGNDIKLRSYDGVDAFEVAFLASDWEAEGKDDNDGDDQPNAWTLPLERTTKPRGAPGTNITIKDLSPEIIQRVKNPAFIESLRKSIKQTYAFFNRRFCRIRVNNELVEAVDFHVGAAKESGPSTQELDYSGCHIVLMTGLAPRDMWQSEQAGWYIFCNGRAVVFADKSALTGWDNGGPAFVSKYRGFRGLLFFFAQDPEKLPWTTTKTDINQESMVYQKAFTAMLVQARPVLTFLNSLYSGDEVEADTAKAAAAKLEARPLRDVSSKVARFKPPSATAVTTTTIQFSAKISEVEKIKKHLRRPSISNREVGEVIFDYYLKNEIG